MKAILHYKKVFHIDVVALTLTCIISLLFTNRVAEFFNHANKKQDHYRSCVAFSPQNESHEEAILANVQIPFEDLNAYFNRYGIAPSVIRLQRLASVNAQIKKDGLVCRSAQNRFEQHPNYILPVGWRTSISIAQRKLII